MPKRTLKEFVAFKLWSVLLYLFVGMSAGCSNSTAQTNTISVDARTSWQTMAGFGISTRVFDDPHIIGRPFDVDDPGQGLQMTTAEQDEILDRLYIDLGITHTRPTFGDLPIEPVNDNSDPENTDLSKFNFEWKRNDAHMELVKRAMTRGLTTYPFHLVFLESWMNENNPEEYVEWAMTIIRRWRSSGLEIPYYSIVNEPGYRRGGIWSGEYIRNVIKLLGPKLREEGFSTMIVIPDDFNATRAYERSQIILSDPEARQYVGALSFHLYKESIRNVAKMQRLSEQYGIPLWMTEYIQKDAFAWANTMHTLIADYNVSAVYYFWGFSGGSRGGTLIRLNYDGNQYLDYTLTKHYYIVGQYSRFVRPGAKRIQADSSNNDIKTTAYRDGENLVMVIINNSNEEKSVQFNLNGISDVAEIQPIRTSETENWAALAPISVSGSTFTTTLSANSITTFVSGDFPRSLSPAIRPSEN